MHHRLAARVRRGAALSVMVVALLAGVAGPARAELPIGGLGEGVYHFIADPDHVPGANDWACRPSAQHPTPVVLVHATFVNLGTNWVDLAPRLKNAGYCVYAFNYGMVSYSAGRIGGLGDITASARTLRAFVRRVLWRTGAEQVDLVGHSQGGMMPNVYLKRLGGAATVRRFVALAPSNHGTTVNGLTTFLGAAWGQAGIDLTTAVVAAIGAQAPGLAQQVAGSPFQRALFGDGDTVPGPRYTVIQTRNDWVVTPYATAFLRGPNVRNVLVQDLCPDDPVGHVGLFHDEPAMQLVLNALGADDPAFRPVCTGYGLGL